MFLLSLKVLEQSLIFVICKMYGPWKQWVKLKVRTMSLGHSQFFGLKLNKYDHFNPVEIVDRGSETQLQVGENLNTITSLKIKIRIILKYGPIYHLVIRTISRTMFFAIKKKMAKKGFFTFIQRTKMSFDVQLEFFFFENYFNLENPYFVMYTDIPEFSVISPTALIMFPLHLSSKKGKQRIRRCKVAE